MSELAPAERARITLDAIEAVEQVAAGQWTLTEVRHLLGDQLEAGLVQYVHLLEAMLTLRGASVEQVRAAATDTCRRIVRGAA